MNRKQLVELNERAECPAFIRDSVVETLGMGLRWSGFGHIIGPQFADFASMASCERVLDLASGTGEPISLLVEWLQEQGQRVPQFGLSDLLPNVPAMEKAEEKHPEHVKACTEPVDATCAPANNNHDTRTIINSFHHFAPEIAQKVLADAVKQNRSVFLYEGFTRNLARLAPTSPYMLPALFSNPVVAHRHRLLKALFTYLLPIIPLVAMWDGFVSVLRVYNEKDLLGMVAPFGADYHWEYREVPYPLGGMAVVFFGIPKSRLSPGSGA